MIAEYIIICIYECIVLLYIIYKLIHHVVSDIQARAEGDKSYIWYNTPARML